MLGLIEDCGIDENDGGTRHPTRRRLVEVCAPHRAAHYSVIRAAVRDPDLLFVNGLRSEGRMIMVKATAAIRQARTAGIDKVGDGKYRVALDHLCCRGFADRHKDE
jgi:hypothetical protein